MKRFIAPIILASSSGLAVAGYDVHITRKENWFDETGPCITAKDLQRLLKADKSIQADKENPGPNFVVILQIEQFPLWLSHDKCNLETKNPSSNALKKLSAIAKFLGAHTQGDDGEIYP